MANDIATGYKLQKVNNQEVQPIISNNLKPEEIKGYDVIPMLYSNIFIAGFRGSGKTTALFHIMKECIDKETKVVVFANTHDCDSSWLHMKEWLEKRKQPHVFYSSIKEDGVDLLDALVGSFVKEAAEEQERLRAEKEQKKRDKKLCNKGGCRLTEANEDMPTTTPTTEGEKKVKSCKWFIVFDDISSELRGSKSVDRLLKQHRHYKSKVVVSSQDVCDLRPGTKNQAIIWLIFKGFGLSRFKDHIYSYLGVKLPVDKLYNIYTEVTKSQGSFLYVNKITGELRKNFSEKIIA